MKLSTTLLTTLAFSAFAASATIGNEKTSALSANINAGLGRKYTSGAVKFEKRGMSQEQTQAQDYLVQLIENLRDFAKEHDFNPSDFNKHVDDFQDKIYEAEYISKEYFSEEDYPAAQIELAHDLFEFMRIAAERYVEFSECSYHGAELVLESMKLNVEIVALFDRNYAPDTSLRDFQARIAQKEEHLVYLERAADTSIMEDGLFELYKEVVMETRRSLEDLKKGQTQGKSVNVDNGARSNCREFKAPPAYR